MIYKHKILIIICNSATPTIYGTLNIFGYGQYFACISLYIPLIIFLKKYFNSFLQMRKLRL